MEDMNINVVETEVVEATDLDVIDVIDMEETDESNNKGLLIGGGLAVGALVTGAAALIYKKFKKAKADKNEEPKKKIRKKLMWVEVEEPAEVEAIEATQENSEPKEVE